MEQIVDIQENIYDLRQYDYFLPKELIAQYPAPERDQARLLVFDRKTNKIEHRIFRDIADYLTPNDCLVINRTKVIPARIRGEKESSKKIEVTLLRKIDENTWEALLRSRRPLLPSEKIFFAKDLVATVQKRLEKGVILQFNFNPCVLLKEIGRTPLPPYIKRTGSVVQNTISDEERYQTIYAQEEGSVAAPTAGLHFTSPLLEKIRSKGTELVSLLLHISGGTFLPVRSEDIRQHRLQSEYFSLPVETAEKINLCKMRGGRIVACGTTVTRVLESQVEHSRVKSREGYTNFYICPGYEFQMVDMLITNFHLPKSTSLILVSAFIGQEKIISVYNEAIKENYRFYSYGDAMLII